MVKASGIDKLREFIDSRIPQIQEDKVQLRDEKINKLVVETIGNLKKKKSEATNIINKKIAGKQKSSARLLSKLINIRDDMNDILDEIDETSGYIKDLQNDLERLNREYRNSKY